MLQTYSIQEIMNARVKDMEDMLYECMKLEQATGIDFLWLYNINKKLPIECAGGNFLDSPNIGIN